MKRVGLILTVVLACGLVRGAGDEKGAAVPAAAAPAMRKYQAAVTAADIERNKAVEKARVALVGELKGVQKVSLSRGDVDGATSCAVLAKKYAAPAVTTETFADSQWIDGPYRIRLKRDGTLDVSDPQYQGTWAVVGERTVALFFTNGYVDVWKFDLEGKSYRGAAFKQHREYEGTLARQ